MSGKGGFLQSRLIRRLRHVYRYYLRCKADNGAYLRCLGGRVGSGCSIYVQPADFPSEPWLVEIGDNVTLGRGVLLITHDGSSRLFRKKVPGMNPLGNRFAPIMVRDNCFIGYNAIILPGVEIGPDSIVGAGSVVTRSVAPGTVVGGNPARHIKTLDEYIESYTERMLKIDATDRTGLREELTMKYWGSER